MNVNAIFKVAQIVRKATNELVKNPLTVSQLSLNELRTKKEIINLDELINIATKAAEKSMSSNFL